MEANKRTHFNFFVCVRVTPERAHPHQRAHKNHWLRVKVDQEFLPSQSAPICRTLTCALTPLEGVGERISEHGNTQSGKRKTLIDFAGPLNASPSRSRCPPRPLLCISLPPAPLPPSLALAASPAQLMQRVLMARSVLDAGATG